MFDRKWFVPQYLQGAERSGKNALDFTCRWP